MYTLSTKEEDLCLLIVGSDDWCREEIKVEYSDLKQKG